MLIAKSCGERTFVMHCLVFGVVLATIFFGQITLAKTATAQSVTFDQVLQRPDDIKLNLTYARQQVSNGRLEQAASALERILLLKPNWDAVRLFYGIVLYRLGDLEGAKRELAILEGRGLSPSQEGDRRKYLAKSRKQTEAIRLTGRYSFGVRTDGNANRASSSVAALLSNVTTNHDEAATSSFQLRLEVDIGNGSGDLLFAEANGFLNEYFDVRQADLMTGNMRLGGTVHNRDFTLTPYGGYSATWVRQEKFRETLDSGLDIQWAATPQTTFYLNGRASYENYGVTDFSPIGSQRDGWLLSTRAGVRWRPMDRQTFTFESAFTIKNASSDGYSFDELQFRIRSLTLIGSGQYLSLSGGYSRTEYDRADGTTSLLFARADDRYNARVSYGVPIETLFGVFSLETPKHITGFVVQSGLGWSSQHSELDKLDYENWSADLMFTQRFGF